MSAVKRLVVCGGNGFLGSRICRYAAERGWDVTSISRSGEPRWAEVSASASPPPWAHKVAWERADILRPATYASLLPGSDYVVHSMGILLEADYKDVVRGTGSPITGLRRAFATRPRQTIDPLTVGETDDIGSSDPRDQFSYETMNRDSAVALARHAASQGVSAFAYISAVATPPGVPSRYLTTKREAEAAITKNFPGMRGIYIRAPFMFDSSRKMTMGIAAMTGAGALFNRATAGVFGGLMGAGGVKPLQVDTVAQAVVESLSEEKVRGPVEGSEMEELAHRWWRNSML